MKARLWTALTLAMALPLGLSACGERGVPWTQQPDTGRWYTQAQVSSGRLLFKDHCASCHGLYAEGAENWQRPKANGNYPPPPLDGTAHAWHHPYPMLVNTIKNGTTGEMPAWGSQLNDQQIAEVIAYFQSRWPDRGYELWLARHK